MHEESNKLKNPDGTWKYTNTLQDSLSPYLLQHAHNPVDWHPWGKEALQRSQKENKPILVSIGYATCYWCHVMERQVFEDPAIAEIMNKHFINVKIDREERPDLDDIYMTARQLLTHEGGWPNNVFLTPDLQPFFAGGVFGPDNRYGRISFPDLLEMLHASWENKRDEIHHVATQMTRATVQNLTNNPHQKAPALPYTEVINTLTGQLQAFTDKKEGGFFQAPKFPHENYLLYLLDYYKKTKDEAIIDTAETTLDKMMAGGIFDQIGGGFHRYSVDHKWLVPHFEKMLYNQALLAKTYTIAYEILGHRHYKHAAESTLDFVLRDMTAKNGAFFSAFDAETDEIEGKFYVWTRSEVKDVLSEKQAELFFKHYNLSPIPKFDGHRHAEGGTIHALNVPVAYDNKDRVKLQAIVKKLRIAREKRQTPLLDDKNITAWNGLTIDALATAGKILARTDYLNAAEKAANYILKHMIDTKGQLYRIARDGKLTTAAFLEDYAFLAQGLLSLYKSTEKKKWLDNAITLIQQAEKLFWDEDEHGYFFSDGEEQTIVRIKAGSDAAIPSDNATMLHNLFTLAELTGDRQWEKNILPTIDAFYPDITRSPVSYTHMVHALLRLPRINIAMLSPADINSSEAIANDNSLVSSQAVEAQIIPEKENIEAGKAFKAEIRITIAPGWHINANPTSLNYLIPTQLDFRGNETLEVLQIVYPKNTRALTYDSAIIQVYDGEIIIEATLKVKSKKAAPLKFGLKALLTVQACKTGMCLSPSDILLKRTVILT